MRQSFVLFMSFALLLGFPTKQANAFSENKSKIIKAVIGATATISSLAIWRHYNKKVEQLEKTQELFARINGIDEAMMWRIRRLTMYKHCSLFVAFLSCGYTIKQVAGLLKGGETEAQEEECQKEINPESSDEDVITPTAFYDFYGTIFKFGIEGLPDDGKEHLTYTLILGEEQRKLLQVELPKAFSKLTQGQILFKKGVPRLSGKARTDMSWLDFDREFRKLLGLKIIFSDMFRKQQPTS